MIKSIYLSYRVYEEIKMHLMAAYPNEGCGVLVGKANKVLKSYRTENINLERSKDRYEIDPKELLRIEKEVALKGLDVVGFYHSHPDHPNLPSEFDRKMAWPDYAYIIVSVEGGMEISAKAWSLDAFDSPFLVSEIFIED